MSVAGRRFVIAGALVALAVALVLALHQYVHRYDPSPAHQVDRYRQRLAAMMNVRDFSPLAIAPTHGPKQSATVFGGLGKP